MKINFLIPLFLIFPKSLLSESNVNINLQFELSRDEVVERIQKLNSRLKFEIKEIIGDSIYSFKCKNEYIKGYDIEIITLDDKYWQIEYETYSNSLFGNKVQRFHSFFESFLRQELDTNYTNQYRPLLYQPKRKEFKKLILKTLINSGYGIYYVGENNPFVVKWDNLVGVYGFGAFELLGTSMMIYPWFMDYSRREKIQYFSIGFGFTIFWKIFSLAAQNLNDFNLYNRFVDSGYLFLKK